MNESASDDNDGDRVCIGIPLVQGGAPATTSCPPSASELESRTGDGPSALDGGAGLRAAGWVPNNGRLLLSLHFLLGVVWALESSWRLIPLLIFGARCAVIAFEFFLCDVPEDEDSGDDDDGEEDEDGDFSGAMRDPFNVGVMIGLFVPQALLVAWMYNHLAEFRAAWPQLKYSVVGVGLALTVPEVLAAKMRNYHRAADHAKHAERAGCDKHAESSAYTLVV